MTNNVNLYPLGYPPGHPQNNAIPTVNYCTTHIPPPEIPTPQLSPFINPISAVQPTQTFFPTQSPTQIPIQYPIPIQPQTQQIQQIQQIQIPAQTVIYPPLPVINPTQTLIPPFPNYLLTNQIAQPYPYSQQTIIQTVPSYQPQLHQPQSPRTIVTTTTHYY